MLFWFPGIVFHRPSFPPHKVKSYRSVAVADEFADELSPNHLTTPAPSGRERVLISDAYAKANHIRASFRGNTPSARSEHAPSVARSVTSEALRAENAHREFGSRVRLLTCTFEADSLVLVRRIALFPV